MQYARAALGPRDRLRVRRSTFRRRQRETRPPTRGRTPSYQDAPHLDTGRSASVLSWVGGGVGWRLRDIGAPPRPAWRNEALVYDCVLLAGVDPTFCEHSQRVCSGGRISRRNPVKSFSRRSAAPAQSIVAVSSSIVPCPPVLARSLPPPPPVAPRGPCPRCDHRSIAARRSLWPEWLPLPDHRDTIWR